MDNFKYALIIYTVLVFNRFAFAFDRHFSDYSRIYSTLSMGTSMSELLSYSDDDVFLSFRGNSYWALKKPFYTNINFECSPLGLKQFGKNKDARILKQILNVNLTILFEFRTFLKTSSRKYFVIDRHLGSEYIGSDSYATYYEEKYLGHYVHYLKKRHSWLNLGVGFVYLYDRIKFEDKEAMWNYFYSSNYEGSFSLDIINQAEKRYVLQAICPAFSYSLLNCSIDAERPFYAKLYFTTFYKNQDLGWDIGIDYHGRYSIHGWWGWQLGFRWYNINLDQPTDIYSLYIRFSASI